MRPIKVPKQKIEFTLPADLKFSALVRHVSREIFRRVGFAEEWASRLQLVVDELFMNANHYGSKTDESKIYILFEYDENEVGFRIEDEGKGDEKITAEKLKEVIKKNTDEINDVTKTSGRGLALISSLWTDSMTIEDGEHGGIVISFTKKIAVTALPISPPVILGANEELKIEGRIDSSNLEEKIQPVSDKIKTLPSGSSLVLDCKDLVYVNSTFLGHLTVWINELQLKQGRLVLRNVNKQIREVLGFVGLTKIIHLES